jgi:ElaB/YqjD/DUF883 family membrane-anchored ribosome-binding protein
MAVQATAFGDGTSPAKSRALEFGRRTARTVGSILQTASRRARDRDVRGALSDIREIVDEHPGTALAAAAVIGFVLARSLARR